MDFSGLFGALSSLAGTIISADMNRTNVTNTNNMNYRIWSEQRADEAKRFTDTQRENRFLVDQAYNRAIEQRDYENYWNSPEHQVQLYRDAGLNPALMMSGQSAIGSASAKSEVGSPPSGYHAPAAPQMQAYQYPDFGSQIGNAISTALATNKQNFDIAYMKREQDLKALDLVSQMIKRGVDSSYTNQMTRNLLMDYKEKDRTLDFKVAQAELLNHQIVADTNLKKAQYEYQQVINQFEPQKQQKLLKNLDAEYDNIMSAIRKNDSDAALSSAQRALVKSQKEGVEISNTQAEELAGYVLDKAEAESDLEHWRSEDARNYFFGGEPSKRLGFSYQGWNEHTNHDPYERSVHVVKRRSDGSYYVEKRTKRGKPNYRSSVR